MKGQGWQWTERNGDVTSWGERLTLISPEITDVKLVVVLVVVVEFTCCFLTLQTAGVETAVSKFADPSVLWSRQGMLRLLPAAMERLFAPTLQQITATVHSVVNNPSVTGMGPLLSKMDCMYAGVSSIT